MYRIVGAPVFAIQLAGGLDGGGWDVQLDRGGDPAVSSVQARRLYEDSDVLRPSQISDLPDNKDHNLSFHHPGPFFLFSERSSARLDDLRCAGGWSASAS